MSEPQKILLIGAGYGRTGTSSLVQALAQVGLKSYHMKEGVFETPGHLDLWHEFLVQKSITIDQVIDRITQDGFNATADVPINVYYEPLMRRYPDARVILTLRKDGAEGWVKSMSESVFLFQPLLKRVPFRWIPRFIKQSEFLAAMGWGCMNTPVNPDTGLPVRDLMAAEYDRWTEQVKATVPEDKLFVFYAHDGWEPLCQFLSPLSPVIQDNCKRVLDSGEPYPHVWEKETIQRAVFTMNLLCSFVELSPFLVALCVLYRFSRSTKPKKDKSN